ncbi:MAG: cysteine desulfurase [Spirochaetales bacterium]|nr:cysteine desulfurase [Spirochaetales bacterium]
MTSHYLDWAATAPPFADIQIAAADFASTTYGNPSSAHTAGRAAGEALEQARARFAGVIGAPSNSIVWTSGGTEADSIALLSVLRRQRPVSIVVSAIEHDAVYQQAKTLSELGVQLIVVRPSGDGTVSPGSVADAIRRDTALVSVMAVNNETGAIQPIAAIVEAVRAASAAAGADPFVHTDAVQSFGKVPFDAAGFRVDAASFSGHKFGGPRGTGALYLRRPLETLARGGGQERGIRPGTVNVPGAWAFAAAAERALHRRQQSYDEAAVLERQLFDGIRSISGATVLPECRNAGAPGYSPYITCVAFPGLGGETLARVLDDGGVFVSTGAACSGARKERRVLDAMGVPRELSFSSVRVSFGRDTTAEDVNAFLEKATDAYRRFKV